MSISHPQHTLPTGRHIRVQTLPQSITAAIIELATNLEYRDDQGIHLLLSPRWLLEPPILAIQRLHKLTLVCRAWRQVVLHTPAMWTRIVIFLEHDLATSLGWLLLCLQRSHRLPLSIYLCTRVNPGHAADAHQELKTVDTLLSAFSSDFHRVVVLSVETFHITSLPDVAEIFKWYSLPQLKTLVLHGTSDESLNQFVRMPQPDATRMTKGMPQYSTLPSLQHLVVDGPNILKMLWMLPNTIHIFLSNLVTLIISNLAPNVPYYTEERLSFLFTLLPSLTKLHTLAFERFRITESPTLPIPLPLLGTSIRWLGMKGMESTAVRYVFECITDPDEVVLVGCGFVDLPVRVPSSCRYLTLFGMPDCWMEYKERVC